MEIELKDIITYGLIILSFVVSYWKSKVDLEKRLTESDVKREDLSEQFKALKDKVNKLIDKDELLAKENQVRFNEIHNKLAELVTSQATNSVFLKENLKHLTDLVKKHDDYLDSLIKKI